MSIHPCQPGSMCMGWVKNSSGCGAHRCGLCDMGQIPLPHANKPKLNHE